MTEIAQGKPFSRYFKVFIPVSEPVEIGGEVVCTHPVSKVATKGICETIMTEEWLRIPDWIRLDTYGVNAADLKKALEDKFEAFRNQDHVRILLIKAESTQ